MKLSILPNLPIPAYRQIYEQITSQILSGELKSGDTLPPIRTVSRELGISVITVRSAWEALERDGLIVSRAGSGCFITELTHDSLAKRRLETLDQALTSLVSDAKRLGFSAEELAELIKNKYEQ